MSALPTTPPPDLSDLLLRIFCLCITLAFAALCRFVVLYCAEEQRNANEKEQERLEAREYLLEVGTAVFMRHIKNYNAWSTASGAKLRYTARAMAEALWSNTRSSLEFIKEIDRYDRHTQEQKTEKN